MDEFNYIPYPPKYNPNIWDNFDSSDAVNNTPSPVGKGMVEVTPEYCYLTIPASYVCVYHKLLNYIADFGKELLDDCNSGCKAKNKRILDCWNMFQSACANYILGNKKEADFFINYIKKELACIYNGTEVEIYDTDFVTPITKDGHVLATVSCNNNTPHFSVSIEDGKLYADYVSNPDKYKQFTIEDFHLFVEEEEL